jgi:hypothetical protein
MTKESEIGRRVVYDISRSNPPLARLRIQGVEVPDGTTATIVRVHPFDMPYVYRLDDGRLTRSGGTGWKTA